MFVKNIIEDIMPDIWPMVLIITVIVSSLRIAYLLNGNHKFCLHKELLSLVFIVYILCLYHVVTFQDVNYGVNNFIPFKEIFRYSIGSAKFIKNIMGNIVLFIPFGFFGCYYLKHKKIITPAILTFVVSLTIEGVQYYIGRVFDIDDIILNVLGGISGFLLYVGFDAIRLRLPKFMKSDVFLNFVIIVIIILILCYSFNINILGLLRGV